MVTIKESIIREEEREKKEPFKERSGIFVKARRGNERERAEENSLHVEFPSTLFWLFFFRAQ